MKQLNVLCVDDNQRHLITFSKCIEYDGHRIFTTTKPEEAIEILKNENIQVLVTDFDMPGINGVSLSNEVRKMGFNGLILLISSDSTVVQKSVNIPGDVSVVLKNGSYKDDLKATLHNYLAELLYKENSNYELS